MKRVVVEELLDTHGWSSQEVADSLYDIQWFNRHFGGIGTMSSLLRTVAARKHLRSLSWLDVGGACGHLAGSTAKLIARNGIDVQPVILDRKVKHLCSRYTSVCGDALNL